MKYLVDTHTLLWSIVDKGQLSSKVIKILSSPEDNSILVSSVSFWEIAIKSSIGKLFLEHFDLFKLQEYCANLGFTIVNLAPQDALSYAKLPIVPNHKDPFDRILIATAMNNNYTLISKDQKISQYRQNGLKLLW